MQDDFIVGLFKSPGKDSKVEIVRFSMINYMEYDPKSSCIDIFWKSKDRFSPGLFGSKTSRRFHKSRICPDAEKVGLFFQKMALLDIKNKILSNQNPPVHIINKTNKFLCT